MSERPFMQLYVSDFIGDTLHLSTEQIGAYMLLLMAMWNAGGKLPADDAKLARVVRMSVKKWRAISGDLMPFFAGDEGHIWHNRLTKELQKSEAKSQSRAAAGAKGAAAKYLKNKPAEPAKASDLPEHSPDTRENEKEEPNGSSKRLGTRMPDDFAPDLDFAMSLGMSRQQAEHEAIKFREWWPAQSGQKAVKANWDLTWKTWCRKAIERLPRGSPPPYRQPSKAEVISNLRESLRHEQPADGRNPRPDGDHGFLVPVSRRAG